MIHDWTRFWCKPDGAVSLADQGFLLPPRPDGLFPIAERDLWRFEEIADRRCLILLGEPGIGKSQAVAQEASRISRRCADGEERLLHVDLGATREESALRKEIFENETFQNWAAGEGQLHLFLDSLDEAVLRMGVVGDLILRGLENADTSRLQLRLACRTSDRLPQFEVKLRELWPAEDSGIYELAPLTRNDVVLAANERHLDAEHFIEEVINRDIAGLAIKPITLNMLIELASEGTGLPESQRELYERGLLALVGEPAERRARDPQISGGLSAWERITVAGRIAAASMLSGRAAIALDATAAPSIDVLSLAELAGREREERNGEIVELNVDETALREVLDTGLFSAHGEHLGWGHQTYAEFLCARALSASGASLAQIQSLLVADPKDGRVVPQLRDVAGWTASLDDRFLDWLAEHDPLVLLRGEVALADEDQRAKLAAALLQKRPAEELDQWDPRNRRNLAMLQHEGLESHVATRLGDEGAAEAVRELACLLVVLCDLQSLQPQLSALALNEEEAMRVRIAAVRGLSEFGDAVNRGELVTLARDPLPEDSDDELKGLALRAVCPTVIGAGEVLTFLTPQKNRHLTGSYSMFVGTELADALTVEELPEALRWARRAPGKHDPMDQLGELAERIVVRSAEQMEHSEIREELAATVAAWLVDHHDLQSFHTRDSSTALQEEGNRHLLVEALVPALREEELPHYALLHSTPRLLGAADLPWLIAQLENTVGGPDEPVWAGLVTWASRNNAVDHDLVMEAREVSPILKDSTVNLYGPIELDSELAAKLREHHHQDLEWEEERRQQEAQRPDFDAIVERWLERFEAGEIDAFWVLNRDIWGEEDGLLRIGGSDLTKAPGWERADTPRRERIAAACEPYLRGYVPTEEWYDPSCSFYPAVAGYRAIRYLAEHDRGCFDMLGAEVLSAWIPAVLSFHGDGEGEREFRDWLVGELAKRCPDALEAGARAAILVEAGHGEGALFVLGRLKAAMDGPLGVRLLEFWRETELTEKAQAALLKALLEAKVPGALEAGSSALSVKVMETERSRARELATSLLASGGRGAWKIWPQLQEHDDLAIEVIQELALMRGADYRGDLDEAELAALFLWLSERFPREDDPERRGIRTLGPRDQIGTYRDQILGVLIRRGSEEALAALEQIEAAVGELPYVRIQMEENWRLKRWLAPRPEDVLVLLADAQRRIVRSGSELKTLLIEALERLGHKLDAEGQAHQLWDTTAKRPKGEVELAAWIADRVREDLTGRGVVINREVEIRANPRGGRGEQTDIHVDAIAGERVEGAKQVTVVVEVKGCWNRELMSAMRSQLAERYLSPKRPDGIYLVVIFGQKRWDDETDSRREICLRREPTEMLAKLVDQAESLANDGFHITPHLLDGSLH